MLSFPTQHLVANSLTKPSYRSYLLLVLLMFSGLILSAQPIIDVMVYEHSSEKGERFMWVIATHPDGRIASVNYIPDATAKKAKTLGADQLLLLDLLNIYDISTSEYNSESLDAYEKRFGKRIRSEWSEEQNWQLFELFKANYRQIITLDGVKARVTLLNRLRQEDFKNYPELVNHLETYAGSSFANIPAPHADQLVHFLIGEYGYEAIEFDRKKWQEGRIDTVYVSREAKFSTLGYGVSEKVLIYTFLGILLVLLGMIAWLLTRFSQFKKDTTRSMNYANRQLRNIDEMQMNKDDSDNLLRMVHLMIKYKSPDSD